MSRYSDDQIAARDAIREDGGPGKLVRALPQAGENPWNTAPASPPEEQDVTAVFLDYKASDIDGTQIQTGDQRVLIAALGLTFDPEVGMALKRDLDGVTETWRIENRKLLAPNGEKILFTLQVRR